MEEFFSNVNLWLGYAISIITIISFAVALIKAIKSKQYDKIKGLVIGFIEEAENLTSKSGEAVAGAVKKEVVLAKIQNACVNIGLKYNASIWGAIVDKYVELTLKVNQREQDKIKLVQKEKTETENTNISVAKEV